MTIVLVYKYGPNDEGIPNEQEGTPFPVARAVVPVSNETTMYVQSQNGQGISINNFMKDSDTFADTQNPGAYYLGNTFSHSGSPDALPFVIMYIEGTTFFNVTLTREPLQEARLAAEGFLKSKLGISENEMCQLIYALSVPGYVQAEYSSVDFRFSFCPDALAL